MRSAILTTAFGLTLLFAAPAMAACGAGADGVAMCGKPAKTQAGKAQAKMSKSMPGATSAPSSKAMAAGGCPCCKNMAMMKGMDGQKDMPGMEK